MPRICEMLRSMSATPTAGMWEELAFDERECLLEVAANVKVLLSRGKGDDAHDELYSHGLDPEYLAALWTRFESGERRVLKAVYAARKERA